MKPECHADISSMSMSLLNHVRCHMGIMLKHGMKLPIPGSPPPPQFVTGCLEGPRFSTASPPNIFLAGSRNQFEQMLCFLSGFPSWFCSLTSIMHACCMDLHAFYKSFIIQFWLLVHILYLYYILLFYWHRNKLKYMCILTEGLL